MVKSVEVYKAVKCPISGYERLEFCITCPNHIKNLEDEKILCCENLTYEEIKEFRK